MWASSINSTAFALRTCTVYRKIYKRPTQVGKQSVSLTTSWGGDSRTGKKVSKKHTLKMTWPDLTNFRSELTISFHMRVSVFLMDTYHDSTAFIWNLQQQILFTGYQLKLSTKIYYVIKPITRREIRYGETQYAVNWNRYCDAVPRADNLYATRTYIYLRTEIKK